MLTFQKRTINSRQFRLKDCPTMRLFRLKGNRLLIFRYNSLPQMQ